MAQKCKESQKKGRVEDTNRRVKESKQRGNRKDLVDGLTRLKKMRDEEERHLEKMSGQRELQEMLTDQRKLQDEDKTPCRTHIFLSAAHINHHTHMRVAQGLVIHSQHVSSTTP